MLSASPTTTKPESESRRPASARKAGSSSTMSTESAMRQMITPALGRWGRENPPCSGG